MRSGDTHDEIDGRVLAEADVEPLRKSCRPRRHQCSFLLRRAGPNRRPALIFRKAEEGERGKPRERETREKDKEGGSEKENVARRVRAYMERKWGGDTDRACHRPQFKSNLRDDRVSWLLAAPPFPLGRCRRLLVHPPQLRRLPPVRKCRKSSNSVVSPAGTGYVDRCRKSVEARGGKCAAFVGRGVESTGGRDCWAVTNKGDGRQCARSIRTIDWRVGNGHRLREPARVHRRATPSSSRLVIDQ